MTAVALDIGAARNGDQFVRALEGAAHKNTLPDDPEGIKAKALELFAAKRLTVDQLDAVADLLDKVASEMEGPGRESWEKFQKFEAVVKELRTVS